MQDIGVLLNAVLSAVFNTSALQCSLLTVRHGWDFALSLVILRPSCLLLRCLQRVCVTFVFSPAPRVVLGAAACPVLSEWSRTEHISSACAVPSSSTFCSQAQHYTLRADGESCCGFLSDCLVIVFRTIQS